MPDRRKVMSIAGAALIAAVTWPVAARSTDMDGTVSFEGGVAIPEGYLEISIENPAIGDDALSRVAETRIESDGKAKTIAFALTPAAGAGVAPALRVVVRLERADGWLLARGSAQVEAGSPVEVTLSTVMY